MTFCQGRRVSAFGPEEEVVEPRMLRADETGAVVAVLIEMELVGNPVLMQGRGVELRRVPGERVGPRGCARGSRAAIPGRTCSSLEVRRTSASSGFLPINISHETGMGFRDHADDRITEDQRDRHGD